MDNETLKEIEYLIEEAEEAFALRKYEEAIRHARKAVRIGDPSMGDAYEEARELLRSLENGEDNMAEAALESRWWRYYGGW